VTTRQTNDGLTLTVEGRVKGPWVGELERAWQAAQKSSTGAATTVDLSAVSFADWRGRNLLLEMQSQGAQLVGGSNFIRSLLDGSAGLTSQVDNGGTK